MSASGARVRRASRRARQVLAPGGPEIAGHDDERPASRAGRRPEPALRRSQSRRLSVGTMNRSTSSGRAAKTVAKCRAWSGSAARAPTPHRSPDRDRGELGSLEYDDTVRPSREETGVRGDRSGSDSSTDVGTCSSPGGRERGHRPLRQNQAHHRCGQAAVGASGIRGVAEPCQLAGTRKAYRHALVVADTSTRSRRASRARRRYGVRRLE